jgi:hypothetical protein
MAEANQAWDTAIVWDHLIDTAKIRYTRFDHAFCERYVDWRTQNPVELYGLCRGWKSC